MRTDRTAADLPRIDRIVVLAAVLLIALLLIQPLFVTRDPNRQAELAWEMYSKGAPRDEFLVVTESSQELVVTADVQPRALATVDYTGPLPAHICEIRAGVVTVEVFRGGELLRTHRCAP